MSETNNTSVAEPRTEADRRVRQNFFSRLIKRPEIGAFAGMVFILLFLAIVAGDVVFNPLGIKNNLSIIAQLGIISIGACMLMISGEFDLSIGSMIGFAAMSMAMMMKWGLPFGLGEATPMMGFSCDAGDDFSDRLVNRPTS